MTSSPAAPPSLRDAWPVWLKVGLLGFGGPAGQIALLHREVVERRRWVEEDRFQHALGFCMLLPGPEAQQLATYLGWLMHGVRGGVVAGLLFVLPGFVVMVALSALYVGFGEAPAVASAMLGIKAAVVALILQALMRVGRRSLRAWPTILVAVLAFAAMTFAHVAFPLVILAAGCAGALFAPPVTEAPPQTVAVAPGATVRTVATWLAVWLGPLGLLAFVLGPQAPVVVMSLFFGQLAVISFGGAYAALAYVAQAAVGGFHWLTSGQMLDGLGLAETTPGPLILTFVFVAFVGAWQAAPDGAGWGPALLAAVATAWAIFAPSFLWIFAGAPYVERLRHARRVGSALRLISAAVVGVIGTLAFWFAGRLLFSTPEALAGFQPLAAGLVVLALGLVMGLRVGVLTTVAIMAVTGLVSGLVGLA
jgi:chromate transporter